MEVTDLVAHESNIDPIFTDSAYLPASYLEDLATDMDSDTDQVPESWLFK